MELYVNNEQTRVGTAGLDTVVRQVLETGLALLAVEGPVEVGVTFVDNETIRELNREYRGIDQATDVLSFAQEEGEVFHQPPGAPRILGDIVISWRKPWSRAANSATAWPGKSATLQPTACSTFWGMITSMPMKRRKCGHAKKQSWPGSI